MDISLRGVKGRPVEGVEEKPAECMVLGGVQGSRQGEGGKQGQRGAGQVWSHLSHDGLLRNQSGVKGGRAHLSRDGLLRNQGGRQVHEPDIAPLNTGGRGWEGQRAPEPGQ